MMKPESVRAAGALLASLAVGAAVIGAASVQAAPPAPAAAPAGCTGTPSQTWLNVVADDLRNGNGLLAVTLYEDDSSKFLVRHGSLYVGRVPAVAGVTRACIFVPKPGVYALALYHDENGNKSFDRTSLGLPAEGFGFSNNPATLAGLPTFKSVRISIPKTGLTTRVHMKYP